MKKKQEVFILRSLFILGIIMFLNLIRKPPLKDWLIIFFFKSYITTIWDNILVKKGYLKYPVKMFHSFDYSFLFGYIIFPVTCVYFNQVTRHSSILGILIKCIIFTFPSTLVEFFLEKYTNLVQYKKSWTALYSFFTLAITFLFVRAFIAIVRKTASVQENE